MNINGQKFGVEIGDYSIFAIRLSLIIIFFFFGYAKWFVYEAESLIPFISNSPLLSWMYPVIGVRGASFVLGTAEWLCCLLLSLGVFFRLPGLLGSMGSTITFLTTVSLLFTTPDAVVTHAGGFPALSSSSQFLLKDIVSLAASILLLRVEIKRNSRLLSKINGSWNKSLVKKIIPQ
ncbi:YkgB family protein [Scandinavium goeteborgense]|uniref:YkgB family protein n=1 Tax=Scandinavium goeteborgense TaxID=1851514 RepID=UPI002165DDB4|nr:YkgB family protein [Scandinavium goeteborgense]MCS2151239.1 YkgB family protein [Scandinavium goeteborgense]